MWQGVKTLTLRALKLAEEREEGATKGQQSGWEALSRDPDTKKVTNVEGRGL